ncbi:MAG: 23S rRNA pseudouridine(2605) synthase RluB [Gammaproteobacteria bacterium]
MASTCKLQKVLANAGFGARREMERWIAAGRVLVNGRLAETGMRVGEADTITLDGRHLPALAARPRRRRVLCYHKPAGEACTRRDPEGRPTVFEHLPRLKGSRWIAIGRLDFDSSGLLLLTNDGELAHRLMHPRNQIEREYAVRVLGVVTAEKLAQLKAGVALQDGVAHFEQVREAGGDGANRWYHVTLLEGRNREVRRLWESQGCQVSRLIRVRFGPVLLRRGIRTGHGEELSRERVAELAQAVGLVGESGVKANTQSRSGARGRRRGKPPRRGRH